MLRVLDSPQNPRQIGPPSDPLCPATALSFPNEKIRAATSRLPASAAGKIFSRPARRGALDWWALEAQQVGGG